MNVDGILVQHPDQITVTLRYPDGTEVLATIMGDHRLGHALLDGLQTRRRTQ